MFDDSWQERFRAPRLSLPSYARAAPDRAVYRGNGSGRWEIYCLDRTTDTSRQVTDRRDGTGIGVIDPSGAWIWWFADTAGDEFGVWMRQPFHGGADEVAIPGLPPSYPVGLALGASGRAVVGRSCDQGVGIVVADPGAEPVTVYHHVEDARVVGLSADERLIAISHSEHGDSRHQALRILRPDGGTVDDLWDGPGQGLIGLAFSPVDDRLLALHERGGRLAPLIWTPGGPAQEVDVELPGDVFADWYPDGSALLIAHDHHGRTELHRYDLGSRTLARLPTPPGVISAATARPSGSVEYSWSSAAEPPEIRDESGTVVLAPPGRKAPPSVPVEDVWVTGPGGKIHAIISRPEGAQGPHPTVFLVHGGPSIHDQDAFAPHVAMWVDHGFAVVRVNYRGSTGYGSTWRDALQGRIGITELEDISAVRAWATDSGLADPDRLVINGWSWGGFLTLLAIGRQPEDWTIGIAGVPVADYVTAYTDEMEPLQAFDRALFGGTPDEVPDRYATASPLNYVDRVRAPVLILAGENDPRCPIRQIDNYVAELRRRGAPHHVYRYEAGHGSLVVEERISHHAAELEFALAHL